MSEHSFKVGDEVTPDPLFPGIPSQTLGQKFVVTKVNPKNVVCDAAAGGRGINYPKDALKPWSDEAAPPSIGVPFEPTEFFTLGEVVTLKRPPAGCDENTPFIVFKDNGEKVNIVRLGGDQDRYLRAHRKGLVRRDMEWLADALLDTATA